MDEAFGSLEASLDRAIERGLSPDEVIFFFFAIVLFERWAWGTPVTLEMLELLRSFRDPETYDEPTRV